MISLDNFWLTNRLRYSSSLTVLCVCSYVVCVSLCVSHCVLLLSRSSTFCFCCVSLCPIMETSQASLSPNVGYSTEGDATKLFVGQIPKNFTEQQVKEIMEPYGTISELSIIKDKETMCSKGK